ncbi:hypothetical protein [Micromonospora rosaria]
MAGRMVVGSTALAGLVRPASAPDPAGGHRVLPVAPELTGLLPSRGLRRGSTVAVAAGRPRHHGGTSLVLALLAEASRAGSWCAVVGVPTFGAGAAAEVGIALDRLALVPDPGPEWATVIAALIDGVDVVVAAVPGAVAPSVADRLAARARQRGSVFVPYGRWDGADVTLRVVRGVWEGLGPGRGRLRRREVTVSARGRGAAARPKEIRIWLPGEHLTRVIPGPTGSDRRRGTAPARPSVVAPGISSGAGTGRSFPATAGGVASAAGGIGPSTPPGPVTGRSAAGRLRAVPPAGAVEGTAPAGIPTRAGPS